MRLGSIALHALAGLTGLRVGPSWVPPKSVLRFAVYTGLTYVMLAIAAAFGLFALLMLALPDLSAVELLGICTIALLLAAGVFSLMADRNWDTTVIEPQPVLPEHPTQLLRAFIRGWEGNGHDPYPDVRR